MTSDKTRISEGYNQTNFEIVEHKSGNYELPVSKSARYYTSENITINTYEQKLSNHDYVLISPYKEQNYLSSKILDCETNEFFHLKIIKHKIQIFPKNEDFSFETFERIVQCINKNIVNIQLED